MLILFSAGSVAPAAHHTGLGLGAIKANAQERKRATPAEDRNWKPLLPQQARRQVSLLMHRKQLCRSNRTRSSDSISRNWKHLASAKKARCCLTVVVLRTGKRTMVKIINDNASASMTIALKRFLHVTLTEGFQGNYTDKREMCRCPRTGCAGGAGAAFHVEGTLRLHALRRQRHAPALALLQNVLQCAKTVFLFSMIRSYMLN